MRICVYFASGKLTIANPGFRIRQMSAEQEPKLETQKWEYLRVMVQVGEPQQGGTGFLFGNYRAVSENGELLGTKEKTRLGEKSNYPNFDEYARQKGEERWEMVGISSLGETFNLVVMFKRPKV